MWLGVYVGVCGCICGVGYKEYEGKWVSGYRVGSIGGMCTQYTMHIGE